MTIYVFTVSICIIELLQWVITWTAISSEFRVINWLCQHNCGTWWRIGRVEAFRPEGRGFESRSRRHAGTVGKSLTRSCLWRFSVKLRHSIRAMSEALMISDGLEEALYKWPEWMNEFKVRKQSRGTKNNSSIIVCLFLSWTLLVWHTYWSVKSLQLRCKL